MQIKEGEDESKLRNYQRKIYGRSVWHMRIIFTRMMIRECSRLTTKKCWQIILLVLQDRVCRRECSIRLPSGMKGISQLPHRIQRYPFKSVVTFVRKTISSLGWKRYLWFAKYISKGGENLEARILKAEAEICCSTAPFYNWKSPNWDRLFYILQLYANIFI